MDSADQAPIIGGTVEHLQGNDDPIARRASSFIFTRDSIHSQFEANFYTNADVLKSPIVRVRLTEIDPSACSILQIPVDLTTGQQTAANPKRIDSKFSFYGREMGQTLDGNSRLRTIYGAEIPIEPSNLYRIVCASTATPDFIAHTNERALQFIMPGENTAVGSESAIKAGTADFARYEPEPLQAARFVLNADTNVRVTGFLSEVADNYVFYSSSVGVNLAVRWNDSTANFFSLIQDRISEVLFALGISCLVPLIPRVGRRLETW